MRYIRTGLLWLLTLLLAVVMIGPGLAKFTSPDWERMFRAWGYPDGFYLVVGVIEVAGGVALLIPRFAAYAGVMLSVVMIAASLTQIVNQTRNGLAELVLAALLLVVAWVRRPAFVRRDRDRAAAGEPASAHAASV